MREAEYARFEAEHPGDLGDPAPFRCVDLGPAVVGPIQCGPVCRRPDGRDRAPHDLFCLTIAIAGTWAEASITFTATPGDPGEDHERRREAVHRPIRRASYCPMREDSC